MVIKAGDTVEMRFRARDGSAVWARVHVVDVPSGSHEHYSLRLGERVSGIGVAGDHFVLKKIPEGAVR